MSARPTGDQTASAATTTALGPANLIIPGVKKAGTTSLYGYLAQHPDVCAGRVKHTNFFRPLAAGGDIPPLTEYARYFSDCGSQRYRMEASTDYFEGGPRLALGIRESLESPRVIISLRDPVSRLWSHFKHKKRESARAVEGLTFEQYIDRCQAHEHNGASGDTRGYAALSRGRYIDFLTAWFDAFGDDVLIVFFEHWAKQPRAALREICAWLDIDTEVVTSFEYSVKNPAGAYRSPGVARLASVTGKLGGGVLKRNPKIRSLLRATHDAVNRQQTDEHLSSESKRRLQEIYAESNRRLAAELGRRGYDNLPSWLHEHRD